VSPLTSQSGSIRSHKPGKNHHLGCVPRRRANNGKPHVATIAMLPDLRFVLILNLQEFFGVASWHEKCSCCLRASPLAARRASKSASALCQPSLFLPAIPRRPRGATGLGDASPQGRAARHDGLQLFVQASSLSARESADVSTSRAGAELRRAAGLVKRALRLGI
jgi:hypothetical protein